MATRYPLIVNPSTNQIQEIPAGDTLDLRGNDVDVNQLVVSGISTLGTIQVSSGIITSTSGIVTYYGDGSKLTGVNAFNVVTQDSSQSPVYPTFANNTGVSSVGISTTQFVFIPSSGNLGIGTENPTSKLTVVGDGRFTGVVTATTFVGNLTGTATTATNVVGGIGSLSSLTVSGLSTFSRISSGNINSSGIITASQFSTGSNGIGINTNTIFGPEIMIIDPAAVGDNTGILRIKGDLYVDGTQTVINYTTLEVADLRIGIGTTAINDIALDGAGIGIGSTSNRKTFVWEYSTSSLKSSENINLASGKTYKINGTDVLSSNTLGSGVVNSSLTSVGTLGNLNVSGVSTLPFINGTNINISGIVTASSFVGNLTGTATTATNLSDAANITTGIINPSRLSGTYNINVDYATSSGVSTNVIGGIASVTSLNVSGVATVSSNLTVNGNTFFVDATNNRVGILTTSPLQPLQVGTGSSIFVIDTMGEVGIGTTRPVSTLQVKDALAFETTNTTTTNTNQVAVDTFATETFRSAKYHTQITCPGQIATLGGITTGGRGYTAGTFNITFTTSSGTGSAAQGTLTISNGTVGQISVSAGGTGYLAGNVLTAGGGSGLQVSVGTTDAVGAILTLGAITSAGVGYTAGVGVGTTSLTFLGGTGTGAVGLATIFDGVITSSALLQQPITGTGGTVYYSGSNYTTGSVLTINTSDVTNTITTITTDLVAGISTFTSLTAHGLFVNDIIRSSSTSNGLTAGTDYYVVTTPDTTSFTLGTLVGVGTTFTTGSSLSIGFYRNSANAGGQVAYTNAITGVSTNYQVSDLLVLQNGTTTDYVEYGTIANNDILGTFATDISGANARLLLTPTYPNNTVKVVRQAITL